MGVDSGVLTATCEIVGTCPRGLHNCSCLEVVLAPLVSIVCLETSIQLLVECYVGVVIITSEHRRLRIRIVVIKLVRLLKGIVILLVSVKGSNCSKSEAFEPRSLVLEFDAIDLSLHHESVRLCVPGDGS